jgi:protein-tyrosine kinase
MSANFDDVGPPSQTEEAIRQALIAECKLTDSQVAEITEQMGRHNLGFAETAMRLGIVTLSEAVRAQEWADQAPSSDASRNPGLIERALRRHQMGGRREVVQHTIEVEPGSSLILAHDHDNARSEQLRALRTQILLLSDGYNQGNILATISAEGNVGRSQLTAELAIAFSQLGRRTLLVDADLRSPKQHLLFNAQNVYRLAQALSLAGAPNAYGVKGLPSLHLITAGAAVPNPLELLSDSRFENLLFDWRKTYDFVLMDTPPLSRYADGLTIARGAGRVLVVSHENVTRHAAMKEMLRQLASTRTQILGAVVNSF